MSQPELCRRCCARTFLFIYAVAVRRRENEKVPRNVERSKCISHDAVPWQAACQNGFVIQAFFKNNKPMENSHWIATKFLWNWRCLAAIWSRGVMNDKRESTKTIVQRVENTNARISFEFLMNLCPFISFIACSFDCYLPSDEYQLLELLNLFKLNSVPFIE